MPCLEFLTVLSGDKLAVPRIISLLTTTLIDITANFLCVFSVGEAGVYGGRMLPDVIQDMVWSD